MWAALRAELAYFRPFLLAAWGIAAGVAVMVNALVLLARDEKHPGVQITVGLPGIFLIVAAMVVGFIAQGTRSEERRARLLLATPLTPRQLGGVLVLLPACLLGLGVAVSCVVIAVAAVVTGELEPTPLWMVAGVAGQLFAVVQMGPLAQEATAARRQRRRPAAVLGWAGFVAAILVIAAAQAAGEASLSVLAQLAAGAAAMAGSAALYASRTDFTR